MSPEAWWPMLREGGEEGRVFIRPHGVMDCCNLKILVHSIAACSLAHAHSPATECYRHPLHQNPIGDPKSTQTIIVTQNGALNEKLIQEYYSVTYCDSVEET